MTPVSPHPTAARSHSRPGLLSLLGLALWLGLAQGAWAQTPTLIYAPDTQSNRRTITEDSTTAPFNPVNFNPTTGRVRVLDAATRQPVTTTFIPQTIINSYGTFTLADDGSFSFFLDNAAPETDALITGDTRRFSFSAQATTISTAGRATITVFGADDPTTITGDFTRAVTETAVPITPQNAVPNTVMGRLIITDPDRDADTAIVTGDTAGAYGTFSIAADGSWTYILNNRMTATNRLRAGQRVTDPFTVQIADGTTATITINITGANDRPTSRPGDARTVAINERVMLTGMGRDPDAGDRITSYRWMQTGGPDVPLTGANTATVAFTAPQVLENTDLTFALTVADLAGVMHTNTVVITVHGPIGGDLAATVIASTTLVSFGPNLGGFVGAVGQLTPIESIFEPQEPFLASYGTFSLTREGGWTYDAHFTIVGLGAGEERIERFPVRADNGGTGIVTITVVGHNNVPVILGNREGFVIEDSVLTSIGTLEVRDLDNNQNTFQEETTPGSYGSFRITMGGVWTYTLDNTNPDVQNLQGGGRLTERFTVRSFDGTTATVVISISGIIEPGARRLGGTLTGIVRAGSETLAIATGRLRVLNADATNVVFGGPSDPITRYGTFTVSEAGFWTYTLDNNDPDTMGLAPGRAVFEPSLQVQATQIQPNVFVRGSVLICVLGPNRPPTANAGQDQFPIEGNTVMLDGTGSSDPDEKDVLAYAWTQSDGILTVNLANATTDTPTFTAPGVNTNTPLEFTLTVTDLDGATSTDTVTITVIPMPDVTVSDVALTVAENGGTDTYTMVLDTQPTGDVTITPMSNIPSAATVSAALIFTQANWNTPQTVTVTGVNDDIVNPDDRTVTVMHTIVGGTYDTVAVPDVTVTVADDDTVGLFLNPVAVNVDEGMSGTYTVALRSQPVATVTVAITAGGDVTTNPTSLTFTASDWNTPQPVTVTAAEDDDGSDDTQALTHTASGGDYGAVAGTVTVTVMDSGVLGVSINPTTLTVAEGAMDTYTVRLDTQPAGNVEITVGGTNGEVNITGSPLTFTPGNWNEMQTVTVNAPQDDDATTDIVTLTHGVTGYGDITSGPTVVVTATDDDTPGLIFNPAAVTVDEGMSGSYTVALATQPTGNVTVAITAGGDVTTNPASLTFTTINWNTAQTVTVTAAEDADGNNDTQALTHTAGGGDYDTVTGTVTVTVTDNDPPGVRISTTTLRIDEGSQATYTVRLNTQPAGNVTITVGGTNNAVRVTGSPVTFTTINWDQMQTVTVNADQDDDATTDIVTLAHGVTGYGDVTSGPTVVVTATDNDTPGLIFNPAAVTVNEGGTSQYTVALATQPTATVTVAITAGGDVTTNPTSLTFTASDWNTPQPITINTGTDADGIDDTQALTHTATGGDYEAVTGTVTVTVTDNDTPGVRTSTTTLRIDEGRQDTYTVRLNTQPAGNVTITVGGTNNAVRVTGSPVTFTTINWDQMQTVTVNADQDDDATTDIVTLTHGVTGYGDVTSGPTVVVTATDNDTPGLIFNPAAVTVNEGGTSQYTVALATQPTVTVTVAITAGGDVTTNPTSLTFTTINWNTAQPVTVTAAEDADGNNDTQALTHTAGGGDYDTVTGTVTVTVTDNDPPGVRISTTMLRIDEGSQATYTVRLNTQPTGNVTITVGGTNDAVSVTGSPLTFTTINWDQMQTVTVNADQDDDATTDIVTLTHGVTGYGAIASGPTVVVTATDDDTPGLIFNPAAVTVNEDGTSQYTVALATQPTATVTVAITAGGDVTTNPASLTFTTSTWNTPQTVTVTAGEDADGNNDTQALTHTATGGDYEGVTGTVTVTVTDNDPPGVRISTTTLRIDEGSQDTYTVRLNTQPAGNVTITVGGTNNAVSVTGSPLSFTTGNWDQMQTVTVNANQDDDATTDIVTLTHGATGYGTITSGPTVVVTATDDDDAGLIFNPAAVNVNESGTSQYTVALATQPTDTVTVAITAGGDVTTNPASLTFTTSTWNTPQPVTVTAGEDADGNNDTETLAHTGGGGDYEGVTGTVTVIVTDNDPPGVRTSTTTLGIDEGSQDTYTVRLNTQPTGNVTITVGGTNDAVSVTGSPLTFTPGNWNEMQTVTVNADQDDDATTETVTLTHGVTGYGAIASGPTVVVTATDDDTPGLIFNPAAVTVDEGMSGSYTVALATQPTATVTVAITAGGDVTTNPTSLTFATINWNTPQTVTVNAAEDDDGIEDTQALTHTAAGGDYDTVTGTVTVTVTDNDPPGVRISTTTLGIDEGSQATYTVRLNTQPTGNVTITVGGTNDAVSVTGSPLTFTPGNWNEMQTVTVTADQDDDATTDIVTLTHGVTGYGDVTSGPTVVVTATDNDTPGLIFNPATVTVNEGGTSQYTVALATQPTATVTVAITAGGDVTTNPTSLTFATINWNTPQTVTVNAAEDDDGIEDTQALTHTAAGGDYDTVTGTVTVTVTDNDPPGVRISTTTLGIDEGSQATYTVRLNTQPTGNVTITVGGTNDAVSVTGSPLTFTPGNWNEMQTVTVTADQDDDATTDIVTLTHGVTGYGDVTSGPTVVVTATDNDTPGLIFNPAAVTVNEDGTSQYTVALATQPTATVTVAITAGGDVTTNPASLTFTTINWNTAQPVTVTAAEDADGNNDTQALTHTAGGGDYDTVTGTVTVTVTDNDPPGVRISTTTLRIAEGSQATYTVRLNTQPTGNVTITVGGTNDAVSVTGSPLTFTPGNWNEMQTVTVNADQDDDATTETVTLTHGVTGYGASASGPTVVVTATDDDTPGLIFNPAAVTVDEGMSGSYTVALATQPTATVTVAITAGGDVTINPTSLTFTASDWNTPQPVTINTGTDDDGNNDTQALTHTATGGDYEAVTGTVTVTVTDNDTPSVRTSTTALTVNEGAMATYTVQLNTQPAGNVTVTVGGASDDVRVTGSPLTFTPGNWNTAQPVTVTADEDADAVPDTPVTLAHTVTGYGDVTRGPTVVVTVTENDRPELIFSAGSVTVHEGESGSYTVALATQPTATVTVAITAGGDVTINPTSLTFTASDWNTPQPVTINTGTDDDGNNDTQALTHTATGGDYDEVTGTVTVTVTDNDTPSVRTSTTALTVNEGAMATYTVQLNTQPAGNVTVTVGGASDDVRVTGSPLTFTPGNWNTAQPVTVTADEDADAVPDTPVTLAHTVTGYGDVTRGPTVVVTVTENDRPELIFSAGSVTVHEGESGSYTVALATQPTATVTVAITAGGDVTINPTSLTFTASDWNTPQPVTINTGTDDDGNNDTQALTHTATGGDYDEVTGTVTVTVTDNDTPSVRTSTTALTVNEGAMATYTVQLNTQPAGNVTVTVGGASDDVRVTGSPLTFTPGNWNTAQPVTVTADEDADAVPDTPVTLAHTVTGYGDVTRGPTVVVTVTENDRPELIFSAGSVTVHEGESGSYTVALATQPTATVTVAITAGGDVTINPTSLTFTASDWNTPQPVTINTGTDADGIDDTQALTHTATGGDYDEVTGTVTVTVTDNDTPSVRISTTTLTVDEGAMATYAVQLNTQPAGNVTVTVGGASDDVRVTGSPLTFTPGNWNTAQPVTVTADEDADAVPDTPVTLAHTVTGYGDVTRGPTVVVTVTENDRPELIFSAGSVTVNEGMSGSYTVALVTQPTATVTVPITAGGDVTTNPTSLTFTTINWNAPQPVTVTAAEDADGSEDAQALTHTATGGDYDGVTGTVTVTVTDNDPPSVRTSTTTLTIVEGAMATYTVQLNTQPAGNVTVTVGGASDDVRVTGSPLTFTPGNWNTAQPVTVTADDDADAVPDTPVTLTHTVTGYGDVTRGPNVVVTVTENDRPELIFSAGSVTVHEGESGQYTVALRTQPTATVTVAITAGGDVTTNPASLTFTTINWNAAQPVTVTAAEDADGSEDTQALTHTATGGDYDGVTGTVTVTVTDNDTPGVRTSTTALTVVEGRQNTYTVQLNTQPAGNVTVTVGGASDDVRVTGSPLTFTPGNWNTAQPITVTADDDADAVPDTPVTLTHTVTGYGAVTRGPNVVVTVTENDMPGLTFSAGSVTVNEGESGSYTVALRTQPTDTVTVAITAGGDVTTNPTSLTFTTINWNAAQLVTVTAAEDADGSEDTQALTHTATGGDYDGVTGTVTVTVTDNDTPGVRTSTTMLTVVENGQNTYTVQLNTQPAGNVTVTVGGASGDVRVIGSPLTFTPGNWNTAQPVTVTADDDADAVPDTPVTLAHTVTGYGDVTSGPNVVVTVTENDRPELIFSAGSVTVNEGESGSYTVALATQPTATVTVAITAGGDVTTNPTSLTFTASDWNAAQPVTITAGTDDDGNNDTQALTHTATGGDYDGVTGTVTVTVTDNDTPSVRTSTTALTVVEGAMATYTVQLNTQPAGNVTVTVGGASGDVRVTGSPLTFTPGNWNTAQPVTVTADDDADAVPDTPVTLAHAVTGYGNVTSGPNVVVTITENDRPELIFSAGSVTVNEGTSSSYTVALRSQPTATVTVAITAGGDVTTNPTSLTFTTINWNAPQPVTINTSTDADGIDDTQALTHTATGGDYEGVTGTVTVTVTDNDTPSVRTSTTALTVNEGAMATYTVQLNTQPAGNVTVTVGGASDDVRVTGSPLTFTPGNWNTAQPVTVTADDDADAVPDTPVTLTHTVTGYGAVTRGPNVVVTVTENDMPGLTFSAGSVTVNEGESGSYTVALRTQPTDTVTVAITAGGDVTTNPTSLTFTTINWNAAQLVTVTAAEDADGSEDTQALTHTATGGDYDGVTGTVTVTVTDNDTPGVRTSTTMLTVVENGQNTYTVQLNTQPAGNVTVTVGGASGDVRVIGSPLTFTPGNWNTAQPVTVTADDDADAVPDTPVTLAHTVTGYGDVTSGPTVVVTVTENDRPELIFSAGSVTVNEGMSGSYTVALRSQPTDTVTVPITAGGDVTTNPTSLTFTTINWNAAQPVTVTAAEDADGSEDTQALTHTATGGDYDGVTGTVTVTVRDNDTPGVRTSTTALTVVEGAMATYTVQLNTQPAGNVTVTVGGASDDVRVTGSPLTFTPGNWNTAQPVTVTADDDADAVPDTPVTLAHTVTGYGAVTSGPTVVVTVTENDMPELIFSAGSVTVNEGTSSSYTVALRSQPTATVTVAITAGGDVTTNPTSLTFTTINWNTPQPITINTGTDADGIDDTQALTHTATGGDYDEVTGTVTVTVTDNDTPGVRISTTTLGIDEGSQDTYTVRLNTQPAGNVTITVGGTNDAVSVTGSPLTFTTGNWDQMQTVTVNANQDDDATTDIVTLAHGVTGYGAITSGPTVVVTVTDDDDAGLIFNPADVTVNEGGTSQYTVALVTQPTATVTVAITAGGDVTTNPASLTFTAINWNTPQPVTVTANEDADGNTDTQALMHTAASGDYDTVTGTVTCTVTENDTPGVRTSATTLRIDEGSQATYTVRLNTKPAGNVTITVGGTNDAVSVTGSPLTFTTINWDQMQTVTVNAPQDDDATTDIVTLTHGVTGYGDVTSGPTVVVTATDNDTPGLIFNPAAVTVDEGMSGSYTVALATQPTATMTVAITAGGDVTTNPAALTFTQANWNMPQTVTVTAAEDADSIDDTQELIHIASGGDYNGVTGANTGTVTVTVRDDGPEADAGPDQVVTVDDEVTLPRDGTGSAEGGPELTYLWTQIDGTPTVTLTNSDTPTATFIAPADPTTLVFSLMVNNDEDNVDTDTDTVTITVTNDTSRIRALKISLAAIGRTLATSTVDVIGNRFEAEEEAPPRATFSGLPCDIPRKQDNADKSGATGRTPDTRGSECKLSWQSLQTQGAFSLSLAPSAPGRLTLWGRGDFTRFQGQPRGLFSLDGELATGYLGMDYRRNDRGLVGVAISHSTGEVDYQIANSTGTLDVELASVYPYIHWTPTKGLGLWGLLGTGLGDATLMHDGLEVKTDLGMRMAAVGLRHELFGTPGSRLAFKADAFWVELEADAVDTLPVVTGEASRGRLALENRLKLYSSPNASMTARMELGLRVDGGNAEQGMGLEAGGRLEYVSQQPGLTIEARGRTLLAHEESKWQEWGASMTIRFDPSLDGQGLAVALTPAWGQATSGVDALWAGQGATSVGATRPDRRTSWKPDQMNLELGYGMALPTRQMLTPFGKLGLTADQSRRLQAGVRLGRIGTPQLELVGEQNNTRKNQPPEYRIGMTWSIPF